MMKNNIWERLKDPYYGKIVCTKGLLAHMARSKEANKVTDPLINYMVQLAEVEFKRTMTRYASDHDDLINEAVKQMLISVKQFDPTLNQNPDGYLSTVIRNAFVFFVHREQKQVQIKENMKDDNKLRWG